MEIKIQSIRKSFRRNTPLSDISFSANAGMCVGILGKNGSGKSTLFSILAGVLPADSGSFLLDGVDLFSAPKQRSAVIGYVPQGTPLLEELSARDNLRLWYTTDELKRALDCGVLAMLGIPDFLGVPVSKMSGGMKKRLSIGCAVARDPDILLLDEPTAALDLPCKQIISSYLHDCKRRGKILLLATHDEHELALCDTLYILRNGVLDPYHYTGDVNDLTDRL